MNASPLIFQSKVTDVRLESGSGSAARWQLALETTLFSSSMPRGTLLAVSPTGARLEVPVLDVLEEEGAVWHVVGKPLAEGTSITGTLTALPLERVSPYC